MHRVRMILSRALQQRLQLLTLHRVDQFALPLYPLQIRPRAAVNPVDERRVGGLRRPQGQALGQRGEIEFGGHARSLEVTR